jgi:hypothetical protein
MTINEAINKVQDVCMSYALDLEKESKEVKDEATAKSMDEESKQLIKATRKLREFISNSIDDGK